MKHNTLAALAGSQMIACATYVPVIGDVDPPSEHVSYDDYQANAAEAQDSLSRLEALRVVEVGELIVDAPEGSQNCYGPCEDDPVDQAWMVVHASQVDRLTELVSIAEELDETAPDGEWEATEDAIAALDALQILEIEGMYWPIEENCYSGGCVSDPHRAGVIIALADRLSNP